MVEFMVFLTWGGKFAEIHQDVLLMKHWKLSIGTFSSLGTCLHKVYQSIHIVISSMSSLTMPITKTQNSDWYTKVITMMTSSNGNMFSVAGPLSENSPITGEFPPTMASEAEPWCFFYVRLNKELGEQSWGWWFETPSRSLLRHCNG